MDKQGLHLVIATPMAVLADTEAIAVRAEDASGSFGILAGHTDLLTVLPDSVVRWRTPDGSSHYCALRSGVMTVNAGRDVAIACREGQLGDDLQLLEEKVRQMRAAEVDSARRARVEHLQLHARAIRNLMRYLRPGGAESAEEWLLREEAP